MVKEAEMLFQTGQEFMPGHTTGVDVTNSSGGGRCVMHKTKNGKVLNAYVCV